MPIFHTHRKILVEGARGEAFKVKEIFTFMLQLKTLKESTFAISKTINKLLHVPIQTIFYCCELLTK